MFCVHRLDASICPICSSMYIKCKVCHMGTHEVMHTIDGMAYVLCLGCHASGPVMADAVMAIEAWRKENKVP